MSESGRILRVAFQGERGAFSEEAAVKLLGEESELVPRPTFDALFAAVEEDAADAVLAPIENSLAGSVYRCYDLLLESPLRIVAEVVIPIAHYLIGLPGASLEGLKAVESHPVALAQCESFFRLHPEIKRIAAEDTAGSVRDVIHRRDPSQAAIAAKRAAKIYGGTILLEHLEDDFENYTRFFLLAPPGGPLPRADKLSLAFLVAHQPGALFGALKIFAERKINLLKIESRPLMGRPWEYRFYVDLQASSSDPEVVAALKELDQCASDIRVLGCYPSARNHGIDVEGVR